MGDDVIFSFIKVEAIRENKIETFYDNKECLSTPEEISLQHIPNLKEAAKYQIT